MQLLKKSSFFHKNLLSWYHKNARDLPWRRTHDPYAIWISEIMLQQTQVKTVIPYYEKWLSRFPTVKHLAEAEQDEVLRYWAGLGYYRRARMIHVAAKKIVTDFGERIPKTTVDLQKLPGIGRYTAAAIASIAYGEKSAVLDGNVIRVLTRLLAFKKDIQNPSTIKQLWEIAQSLMPGKQSGDYNQAMMELGATICTPENPACLICPVAGFCEALKLGKQTMFPIVGKKEIAEKLNTAALILRKNGKVLICQQGEKERWGGLWMFPHWESPKKLLKDLKLKIGMLKPYLSIQHGFTKYRIKLDVFEAIESIVSDTLVPACRRGRSDTKGLSKRRKNRWVKLEELTRFAFPSPHQKIATQLIEKTKTNGARHLVPGTPPGLRSERAGGKGLIHA